MATYDAVRVQPCISPTLRHNTRSPGCKPVKAAVLRWPQGHIEMGFYHRLGLMAGWAAADGQTGSSSSPSL